MTHPRATIRNAVADRLSSIATVRRNRAQPLQREDVPCLAIYTRSEAVTEGLSYRERNLDLVVDAYAKAGEGLDDALDDLVEAIEAAVDLDPTFGGLAVATVLTNTVVELSGDGETAMGVVRLWYRLTYDTPYGQPAP